MCSFSWRDFGDCISVVFNRDESITRAKAVAPKVYSHDGKSYIMPLDPDAGGSWICVNQAGLAFALLNNYQGRMKPSSASLISRGQIIKDLALMQNLTQIQKHLATLQLEYFQPFTLMLVSHGAKRMWQHDGRAETLTQHSLPEHYFSSAHPQAKRVLDERNQVAMNWSIASEQDLIALHKAHLPNNSLIPEQDRTFSICMHHDRGHTQSLSAISLYKSGAVFKYWDGQPCQTDHFVESSLTFAV